MDGRPQSLTAKFYQSDVRLAGSGQLEFRGLRFIVAQESGVEKIVFEHKGGLASHPLRELLAILFRRGVLKPANDTEPFAPGK